MEHIKRFIMERSDFRSYELELLSDETVYDIYIDIRYPGGLSCV